MPRLASTFPHHRPRPVLLLCGKGVRPPSVFGGQGGGEAAEAAWGSGAGSTVGAPSPGMLSGSPLPRSLSDSLRRRPPLAQLPALLAAGVVSFRSTLLQGVAPPRVLRVTITSGPPAEGGVCSLAPWKRLLVAEGVGGVLHGRDMGALGREGCRGVGIWGGTRALRGNSQSLQWLSHQLLVPPRPAGLLHPALPVLEPGAVLGGRIWGDFGV